MARLQEELIGVKLREAEALTGLKELRQQVRNLEDHWQVSGKTLLADCVDFGREKSVDWAADWLIFTAASPSSHHRPLEGQLQEEHAERAAGRADEREAARGRGPGGAAGDQAEDAGDGDAGATPRAT